MDGSVYAPYRSEAARDSCFAYLDSRAAAEWPVPSEGRTVPTSYGPTFVRVSGPADAPTLVLLPGAVTPSLMWAPNIVELAAEYRTFAVDQMGDFGRSLCIKPLRRYDDLLLWLDELLEGLDLRGGVNLAGISYGGALAAEYALHNPQRLNKVVIIAPGAAVLRLSARFVVRLILAALAGRRCLPLLFRWMFADAARKDPAWVDKTLEQLFMAMRCLRRRLPNPRVWPDADWRRLSVPALFLVGEHETIYSAGKAVRRLNRVAPQVKTAIITGAGHDLTFAQASVVNQSILGFLSA